MVKHVIVEHACHKGRQCVFLKFDYDAALIALVKAMATPGGALRIKPGT